jgi:NAD(P)-dependent dehydrogenase (short-subunit alcohol dehydrogenase family)
LTRVCARELGQYGINVNAIAPGIILTELIYREAEDPERLIEEKSKMAALGRAGITQDIANLALFLSTDESTFITGQIVASDGGRTGIT